MSYAQLPGTVKNKLQKLNISQQMIETVRIFETQEKTLYAISILQNDKLRTLRIRPNGQMENAS
jgi:hypothetical protein